MKRRDFDEFPKGPMKEVKEKPNKCSSCGKYCEIKGAYKCCSCVMKESKKY